MSDTEVMSRIAANDKRTRHSEEIEFLNRLCIDLKKFLIGWNRRDSYINCDVNAAEIWPAADGPVIGMNRLDEFSRVIANLEQCKEQMRFMRMDGNCER